MRNYPATASAVNPANRISCRGLGSYTNTLCCKDPWYATLTDVVICIYQAELFGASFPSSIPAARPYLTHVLVMPSHSISCRTQQDRVLVARPLATQGDLCRFPSRFRTTLRVTIQQRNTTIAWFHSELTASLPDQSITVRIQRYSRHNAVSSHHRCCTVPYQRTVRQPLDSMTWRRAGSCLNVRTA